VTGVIHQHLQHHRHCCLPSGQVDPSAWPPELTASVLTTTYPPSTTSSNRATFCVPPFLHKRNVPESILRLQFTHPRDTMLGYKMSCLATRVGFGLSNSQPGVLHLCRTNVGSSRELPQSVVGSVPSVWATILRRENAVTKSDCSRS